MWISEEEDFLGVSDPDTERMCFSCVPQSCMSHMMTPV